MYQLVLVRLFSTHIMLCIFSTIRVNLTKFKIKNLHQYYKSTQSLPFKILG